MNSAPTHQTGRRDTRAVGMVLPSAPGIGGFGRGDVLAAVLLVVPIAVEHVPVVQDGESHYLTGVGGTVRAFGSAFAHSGGGVLGLQGMPCVCPTCPMCTVWLATLSWQ
jgi:hypothetical protein